MPVSRRNFIKNSPGLTLAAAAGQSTASAETTTTAPAKNPLLDKAHKPATGKDFTTESIHMGEEDGFSVTSIYQAKNVRGRYQRPQRDNPTIEALEAKVRALEGAEASATGGTGMAAISTTVLALCNAGDRIIAHRTCYATTTNLFRSFLPRWNIQVEWVDMNDLDRLGAALRANKTRMVWWESYVNPTMETLDGPGIIKIAKEHGALSVTDNTFLSQYLFQPLRYGADLSVHSATKYISGHGNAMGGIVTGPKALVDRVQSCFGALGGQMRPFDAFLIAQGIKTLSMRMERHCTVSQKVAEFLEKHPAVARVRYGGLPSWTNGKPGTQFVKAWGGMMAVEWKSDAVAAGFQKKVKMAKPWASLGDVVTLVINQGEDASRALPPRFTRISIGLEDADDIIADFGQAIDAAAAAKG